MNRRENLKSLGMLSAHALFPAVLSSFFSNCSSKEKLATYQPQFFSYQELSLLSELADLIIPATDTPGASEAGVHVFIDSYLLNCFSSEESELFREELKKWHKSRDLAKEEKFSTLKEKEAESHTSDSREAEFIKTLKSLTLLGYFYSEKGAAASSYIAVPGNFEGCIDLSPDQNAELLNSMT